MIVSIGEAKLASDNGTVKAASMALSTAYKLSQMGESVMFVGPIADDEQGAQTLEFIIDNCIFFDPAFCKGGSFTEKKLEDVFVINDDVNVVVLSGDFLDDRENVKILYNVLKTKKDVKIYLNAVGRQDVMNSELPGICTKVRVEEDKDPDYDARVAACLQNGAEEV